jgi:hypothetical protein
MNLTPQKIARIYLDTLLEKIAAPIVFGPSFSNNAKEISLKIFRILSSREFTYFTRIKSEPYKEKVCKKIEDAYNDRQVLFFYFNLGGGYHARISNSLSFDPGLSEFLALFQIKKFLNKASLFYPFGINFKIIIDNRGAEFANNIPVAKTESFAAKLKKLIQKLGLENEIKLIIESKIISKSDFQKMISQFKKDTSHSISDKDCLNANRFLNNTKESVAEVCVKKYTEIKNVLKNLSIKLSDDGVLLTQRATQNSFPFRSFPGGDSKIQCGKVALLFNKGIILRPILITSTNIKNFNLIKINLPKKFVINDLLLASENVTEPIHSK